MILALEKTDHKQDITIRDDMTLQYGKSGVTNPLENHSCSMILPHCSIPSISYHNEQKHVR